MVVLGFKQCTVVLVRFPFSNLADYKIRPALVISNDSFNKVHSNYWICPMTTKSNGTVSELEVPVAEFVGRLDQKSFIRTDVIATVDDGLILKELGMVSGKLFRTVVEKIKENLG